MHNSHRHRWLLLPPARRRVRMRQVSRRLVVADWRTEDGPRARCGLPGRAEKNASALWPSRPVAPSPADVERIAGELAAQFRTEDDPLMRAEIVRGLASVRTTTAGDGARTAIDDPDTDVRIAACHALSRFGGPDAISLLSQARPPMSISTFAWRPFGPWGKTKDPAAVAALGRAPR